jgi:membrane protein required for colicin V production
MIIDILLLIALAYGIYLGYTQGVFRISILALAITFGLLCSMYLTAPAAEFTANFFGFHYRLLPLLVFLLIVLLLSLAGIFIFKKIEKNLKNTKIAKTEKYFGAVSMTFFATFLFAVILSFFTASNAIKKEIKENSFTYSALESFSDSGMELIKKLAPFVTTFVNTLSGEEMTDRQKTKNTSKQRIETFE